MTIVNRGTNNKIMKAFLLTAGLGTRLRPLTNDLPKCLLPICGKPLLEIWLDLLGLHGVDEVLVNTHWQHEKVERYFLEGDKIRKENGRKWPRVRLFYEKELLGSAGTLLANKDWVADGQPFFILYGDNLTNVDLGKMLRFHEGHHLPFTLGVFKADDPKRSGIAEVDKGGVVVGFEEKPKHPKSDLAAAGTYITDNRIFDVFPESIEEGMTYDIGYDILPKLAGRMMAYRIREFLMDIGTMESYRKAQDIYPQIG